MTRESGSITLLFASVLAILLAFLALAVDLSRLYLARTTWQGAADAAALAGAQALDGTLTGTETAVLTAQAVLARYPLPLESMAALNPALATFRVGSCPYPDSATSALQQGTVSAPHWSAATTTCPFSGATAQGTTTGVSDASTLQYLEVDTGNQAPLAPYFAQALAWLGTPSAGLTPFGYAVAGHVWPAPTLLYR